MSSRSLLGRAPTQYFNDHECFFRRGLQFFTLSYACDMTNADYVLYRFQHKNNIL